MTKRVLNTGLRHTPSEKEDSPVPKGFCRQSVNATTCYSNPLSQTSHIPIPNAPVPVFPPVSNSSSLCSMHQKPPTGLPIISSNAMSPRPGLQLSAKNKVHPTANISHSSLGFQDMNSSLPMGSKAEHAMKNIPLPDPGLQSSPRTLRKERAPLQVDAQLAYENMMLRYFVPTAFTPQTEILKTGACSTFDEFPLNHNLKTHVYDYIPSPSTHSISTMHMDLLPSPPNSTNSPASEPACLSSDPVQQSVPVHHAQYQGNTVTNYGSKQVSQAKTQVALDITPSGCTVLEAEVFPTCGSNLGTLLEALATEERDFQNKSSACSESSSIVGTKSQSLANETRGFSDNVALSPGLPTRNNFPLIPQSRLVTNAMSTVFMSPPEAVVHDSTLQNDGNFMFPSESSSVGSAGVESCISVTEHQDVKSSTSWGRFSVLPPLSTNDTPVDSIMSCNSSLNSGQTGGMVHSSYSPFTAIDFQPAIYAASPRSSFSGRGSRNKRALSNSPLSADGIDLNSIIRMSPTSLITYLNGSRSSSSCMSPGSAGERSGCYGHLSARNSSSSPRSGSGSSGAKRSISHTSITGSTHQQRETSVVNSDISVKSDLFDLENSMFVLQTMQELETNCQVSNLQPAGNQPSLHSTMVPECDNLRILPQDEAIYRCEEYLPYIPMNVQPVQNYIPTQQQIVPPSTLKTLLPPPSKPPPTYAQHMARKATLEKKSSSDSSQPSNSNSSSFESTEGGTGGGNSSTDSDLLQTQQRMYECRWLDCSSLFQDLEEFVSHIEKQHMDQRKGEEFICFWRNCPRRMHPFNQRYKLLMHMRVHSGDKPNKCTYTGCKKAFSRLENLKIHMRSHTGERPYSCPYQGCNKTFSNSSDRAKHQKTHQDMRPYICQVPGCGKRYTDPSSLRKHAKGSHAEKKEPGRKKIRGGIEELDPKDLNECLVIKGLKPIPQNDVSPPERTDSGLGKSPRGSHLGFLSDHYSSFGTSGETSSRSGTAYGSNHTSPSSHHSSPRGLSDINESEKSKQLKESSLLVPTLPPIVQSPLQRNVPLVLQGYRSATHTPSVSNSPRNGGSTSSSLIKSPKSSPKTISITNMTRELVVDNTCATLNAASYNNQNLHSRPESSEHLLLDTFLDSFSRFEGVS